MEEVPKHSCRRNFVAADPDNLKEGDYVFIEFGHNDQAKADPNVIRRPQIFKRTLRGL